MRKRLISPIRWTGAVLRRGWLELDRAAVVEVTSEAAAHPIEEALLNEGGRGWRAATPGVQTVRLLFDKPQTITHIRLVFKEQEFARTQEFVLGWSEDGGTSWKDIVRQQWNFSPPTTVDEREDYGVELSGATALELTINPDISRSDSHASLESLQVAARRFE
jgi:hypothetical protein